MSTRIKGFGACFGIGVLVCVLGSLTLALNPLNVKVLRLCRKITFSFSAFCRPLHNWKPHGYRQVYIGNCRRGSEIYTFIKFPFLQHLVPDGSHEAALQHVCQNEGEMMTEAFSYQI